MNTPKARLGVPRDLMSCHAAQIDGYVVEGHVPAGAIKRLLTKRLNATGPALPGLPDGSSRMEVEGIELETSGMILFGPAARSVFARHRGVEMTKADVDARGMDRARKQLRTLVPFRPTAVIRGRGGVLHAESGIEFGLQASGA